ncbi:MAG: hypothetical protein Q9206_002426, partial [Seirophora lacunosa]
KPHHALPPRPQCFPPGLLPPFLGAEAAVIASVIVARRPSPQGPAEPEPPRVLVLLEFPRGFLPERFCFLQLSDRGVQGTEEGFGFGVELLPLRWGEVFWCLWVGGGMMWVESLESRWRVDA